MSVPYRSAERRIRLALGGDVMPSRRLRPFDEPAYLALVELLRGADLAFANLETVVREDGEGHPNFTQGTPMSTPPALLDELRWFGLSLFSIANNHASDYGTGGVEATVAHLRAAGLPAAGAGRHLAAARAPAYADTRAGRVGLVAVTSFFRPWNAASDQRPDAPGRPGIAPQAFATSHEVDAEAFGALQRIGERLGLAQERRRHARQFYSAGEIGHDSADRLTLWAQQFQRGERFAVHSRAAAADLEANLRAIREARRQCDWLIVSLHSHEFGEGARLSAETDAQLLDPSAAAVEFAHAAIDAGADVVAGHGPHVTLGAEIYRGRPIFYSLGNLIFQNDTVQQFPAESYRRFGLGHEATPADFLDARTDGDRRGFPAEPEFWEGALATVDFEAGAAARVLLHPLDLGFGARRAERGRPVLAGGAKAERILERLASLSRRHGTRCAREGSALRLQLP